MSFNFPYTSADLTQTVNRLKIVPPRTLELGLFKAGGYKKTTQVMLPLKDFGFSVLANRPRGGDNAPVVMGPDEKSIIVQAPYTPAKAYIVPGDIQDQWDMDEGREKSLADIVTERMVTLRENFALTREYMNMAALGGILKDGEDELLIDFYTLFGITKKIVDFDLDNPQSDILEKCAIVTRHIGQNLKGESSDGVYALVSPEFFTKLTAHPNVQKFYLNYVAAMALVNNAKRMFTFGGITFEEDNRLFPCLDGETRPAVTAGKGRAFPTGTKNTFRTYFCPPHKIGDANRPGKEIYVSPKILDHDQGVEFLAESSMLPICVRPEILVELYVGAPAPAP